MTVKRYLRLPIYNVNVLLYVSGDAIKTFNRIAARSKMEQITGVGDAVCQSDGKGNFYLVFNRSVLDENAVAHEVGHCTDRVMEFIEHNHCKHCSNEPHQYLRGYLQEWVKRTLKRAGVKVR